MWQTLVARCDMYNSDFVNDFITICSLGWYKVYDNEMGVKDEAHYVACLCCLSITQTGDIEPWGDHVSIRREMRCQVPLR